MKHKKLLMVILPVVAVLLGFTAYVLGRPVTPSGDVHAFFHFYASPARETLEAVLEDYSDAYPGVNLTYTILPYQDLKRQREDGSPELLSDPHRILVSSLTASDLEDAGLVISPGSWTGQEWRLCYNREVLEGLGLSEADLTAAGLAGFDHLVETLQPKLAPGQALFSVGARFYLPWLTWVQHLEVEAKKGAVPGDYSADSWARGIVRFDSLVESGGVNENYRDINEAESILRMFRGDSLFVLSNSSLYSVLLPANRPRVGSLPFPGSTEQGWYIGSGFYLAFQSSREKDKAVIKAAEALITHLRSPEVREVFLEKAGVLLKPEDSRQALREIPSLTQTAGRDDLEELLRYIR